MATYPSGATISTTAFSTVGTATYSSTGSTTTFAVPGTSEYSINDKEISVLRRGAAGGHFHSPKCISGSKVAILVKFRILRKFTQGGAPAQSIHNRCRLWSILRSFFA